MVWNKPVTKDRYNEILTELRKILSDFKLDVRGDWAAQWQQVRSSQWVKIAEIPEFDLELTKKITQIMKDTI